jgi:hypothetical protein
MERVCADKQVQLLEEEEGREEEEEEEEEEIEEEEKEEEEEEEEKEEERRRRRELTKQMQECGSCLHRSEQLLNLLNLDLVKSSFDFSRRKKHDLLSNGRSIDQCVTLAQISSNARSEKRFQLSEQAASEKRF